MDDTTRRTRRLATIFVAATMAALFLPCALVPLVAPEVTSAAGAEAEPPSPADGLAALGKAGAWLEQHFALRNELIEADARLNVALLGTSNTNQVVVGDNGWLYYGGELADHRGNGPSDDALLCAAHNLQLAKGYVEGRGASLVVMVAPNKSTVYPEHLPPWEPASPAAHACDRLLPLLAERGVACVDAHGLLRGAQEASADPLYYLTDSHWTDEGAGLVAEEALRLVGRTTSPAAYEDGEMDGDLAAMLYPASAQPERARLLVRDGWELSERTPDVTEGWVVANGSGEGTLLLFRDSFANNLVGHVAPAFGVSYLSKMVPYDLTLVDQTSANVVLVERAERHLADFATNPPAMPAPEVGAQAREGDATGGGPTLTENGAYLVARARLDGPDEARAFVEVLSPDGARSVRGAFLATDDQGGFEAVAYLPAEDVAAVRSARLEDGAWEPASAWTQR